VVEALGPPACARRHVTAPGRTGAHSTIYDSGFISARSRSVGCAMLDALRWVR
jgi:hypothetical protein